MELDLPLFPGYLFTRVPLSCRLRVLESPGAVRFVALGDRPTPLEDCDIECLKSGLRKCPAGPHPYLHVGDYVRVRSGPFAGMVGILVRKKKDFRVVLSVEVIAQSIAVELDLTNLDTVPLRRPSIQSMGIQRNCMQAGGF